MIDVIQADPQRGVIQPGSEVPPSTRGSARNAQRTYRTGGVRSRYFAKDESRPPASRRPSRNPLKV